jgi:hypothetical protein
VFNSKFGNAFSKPSFNHHAPSNVAGSCYSSLAEADGSDVEESLLHCRWELEEYGILTTAFLLMRDDSARDGFPASWAIADVDSAFLETYMVNMST